MRDGVVVIESTQCLRKWSLWCYQVSLVSMDQPYVSCKVVDFGNNVLNESFVSIWCNGGCNFMVSYFFQSYLHITSNVATKCFSLIQPFVFIIEPCTVCFRSPWILSLHVLIDTRNCKKGVIFLESKFSLIPQAQTCEMFDQYLNEHLLLNHYSVDLFYNTYVVNS